MLAIKLYKEFEKMKVFYSLEVWFCTLFWLALRGIFARIHFVCNKTFRFSKSITFALPEWQKMASVFCWYHFKTPCSLIWMLWEPSTLTNSMFAKAKTIFQQKSFWTSIFFLDRLGIIQGVFPWGDILCVIVYIYLLLIFNTII